MPGVRYSHGRRRFVQLLGWASVIAAAPGGPALAQIAGKNRGKSSTRAATPPAAEPPKPPEVSDEARALGEVVRQRYGEHLSAEDLESVTRDLDGDLKGAKRLRDVKLQNADEPDLTFHA